MEKKNTGVYYVLWAVLACGVIVDILAGIWNKSELFVLAIVLFSWPHTVSSQKIKNAAQDAGKSMKAMKIYAIVLSVIAILLLLNTYIEVIAVKSWLNLFFAIVMVPLFLMEGTFMAKRRTLY